MIEVKADLADDTCWPGNGISACAGYKDKLNLL